MKHNYLTFFFIISLCFGLPTFVIAVDETDVQDSQQKEKPKIYIGKPKEIFVKPLPKIKKRVSQTQAEPKSLKELWVAIKGDLRKASDELDVLAKDLATKIRPTYDDPDFVPPERPDWR